MDLLVALLQAAGYLAIVVAVARPPAAAVAAAVLLLAAVVGVGMGVLGPPERELVCRHTYVAYEGQALEPAPVHFPTETVRAAGWLWPLPYAGFALVWSLVLWRRRHGPPPGNAFVLPLALAWTATAIWLGMQKLAAPAAVVQPIGLERCLWPAGLLLTIGLARSGGRFTTVLLSLCLGIVAARLPAALFSKYASDHRLGTGLDVSGIVDVVNPLTRMQFEPRLVSGSAAQQFWLIWAEHVFAYPAFHLLSLGGIACLLLMLQRHARSAD